MLSEEKVSDLNKNEDDFIKVKPPYSTEPYYRKQVNAAIFGGIHTELSYFSIIQKIQNNNEPSTIIGWIFHDAKHNENISVLKVVNIPLSEQNTEFCDNHPSLATALESYKSINIDCKKLIIPISIIKKNHYCLLTIDFNKCEVTLFDSKSKIMGSSSDLLTSGLAAIYLAVEDNVQSFYNLFHFFKKSYNQINETCKLYFSDLSYKTQYLNHQAWNNHFDCGPYTVEYALSTLANKPLTPELKIFIENAREKHEALFASYKSCVQMNFPNYSILDNSFKKSNLVDFSIFRVEPAPISSESALKYEFKHK